MSKVISNLLKNYSFYKIQKSKSNQLIIRDEKSGICFLKSKDNFIEEVYFHALSYCKDTDISKELNYMGVMLNHKKDINKQLYEYLVDNNYIKLIMDLKFCPIEESLLNEKDGTYLNSYIPTKYLKKSFNNSNINSENFPYIKKLILNLCANDVGAYEYNLKVLSHSICKPDSLRHGYLVYQGQGASGKGTFFELIMKPIFEKYFMNGTLKDMVGNFNSHTAEKLWVVIEEQEEDVKKGESSGAVIKYVSGTTDRMIEKKGKEREELKCYTNYAMTSNASNLGLELKQNDRRATIFGFSRSLGGSIQKAPEVRIKMVENIPNELDNFVSYLKNLEFDSNEIFKPYENKARNIAIKGDLNNVGLWIYETKETYEESTFNFLLEDIGLCLSDITTISHKRKDDKIKQSYLLADDIYKFFTKYCEINNKKITSSNRFFPDFYSSTSIDSYRIKKEDKNGNKKQLQYIYLKDFLNYFKLIVDYRKTIKSNEIEIDYTDMAKKGVLLE